ncbi:MAG: hypothetical protein JST59_05900 [Actinobacteria bacterium]|nr:hypothetical protein [Actinomycetota bacterium]
MEVRVVRLERHLIEAAKGGGPEDPPDDKPVHVRDDAFSEKVMKGLSLNLQTTTGAVLGTLTLFPVAVASVLVALARGEGTNVTFAITTAVIIWMLAYLVLLEFVIFTRNPMLEIDLDTRLNRDLDRAEVELHRIGKRKTQEGAS